MTRHVISRRGGIQKHSPAADIPHVIVIIHDKSLSVNDLLDKLS